MAQEPVRASGLEASVRIHYIVIAELNPAIHPDSLQTPNRRMDARVKPGHDEEAERALDYSDHGQEKILRPQAC
jgi:hypothetical protein